MPVKIIAIVPAYNEENNIAPVIADLRKYQPDIKIVILNDASTDQTEKVARASGVTVLNLAVNLGIGGAVQTGFIYARDEKYDIAFQFDGDGQHLASEINKLLKPLIRKETDVVIGSRFLEKGGFRSSLVRQAGIRLISLVNKLLTGRKIMDSTSGFRAFNQKAISFLAENYSQDYPEPEAVVQLLRNGFNILEVPVQMRARLSGQSSIRPIHSFYYIIKVLLSNMIGESKHRRKYNDN
ncbi:MAG: glycosyltransferase family 2 protein [candidate division Zixibacteria bacterium]|nr:glycosyltransferase family 2 protein [candidate division Zixibacteria bacterium]